MAPEFRIKSKQSHEINELIVEAYSAQCKNIFEENVFRVILQDKFCILLFIADFRKHSIYQMPLNIS